MYEDKTVGVVIPAYNEQAHVGTVLDTLPSFVDVAYAVDDASTDETWEVITERAFFANDSVNVTARADGGEGSAPIVPIRHERNRGVGGAIKTGYLRALEDDVDVVAVMGGDGQMDPDLLDRLVEPVADGRIDYAKGNRLLADVDSSDMPAHRYVGNVVLTLLTRIASGYWTIGDPQNGYTAISADALEAIDVEEMYEFYGYCNDLLVKLHVAGMRVGDVPMPASYGDESSHISYSEYVPRVSAMLFRNFLGRLRAEYGGASDPVSVGYLTGVVGFVLGPLLALSWAVGLGSSLSSAVLVVAVGIVGFVTGALGDHRRYRNRELILDDPATGG